MKDDCMKTLALNIATSFEAKICLKVFEQFFASLLFVCLLLS